MNLVNILGSCFFFFYKMFNFFFVCSLLDTGAESADGSIKNVKIKEFYIHVDHRFAKNGEICVHKIVRYGV